MENVPMIPLLMMQTTHCLGLTVEKRTSRHFRMLFLPQDSWPLSNIMSTSGKRCNTLNHILLNQWQGIFSFTVRQKKGKSLRKKFSNIEGVLIIFLVRNLQEENFFYFFLLQNLSLIISDILED